MAWLEDAHRKLGRADEHLSELESQMGKKLDAKEYTVTREAEMKILERGARETRLGPMELVDPPEMPPEWSLLIGDFAFNARAALDHLAWELAGSWAWRSNRARRAGKPWPPRLYFPIYAYFKKPGDRKALKTKLNKFSPTHRKAIASVQPHRRGKLGRAEPLWLLDEIRNSDAHRELHTVLAIVPFSAVMGWLDKSGLRYPPRCPPSRACGPRRRSPDDTEGTDQDFPLRNVRPAWGRLPRAGGTATAARLPR